MRESQLQSLTASLSKLRYCHQWLITSPLSSFTCHGSILSFNQATVPRPCSEDSFLCDLHMQPPSTAARDSLSIRRFLTFTCLCSLMVSFTLHFLELDLDMIYDVFCLMAGFQCPLRILSITIYL